MESEALYFTVPLAFWDSLARRFESFEYTVLESSCSGFGLRVVSCDAWDTIFLVPIVTFRRRHLYALRSFAGYLWIYAT
jgi:hypothetical protein